MNHDEKLDRIIQTATDNIEQGVISEPRIFFDEITIPEDGTIAFGSPDAFKNGEPYPIRIRWMTCGLRYLDAAAGVPDERLIQRVGLRFTFHGQDYMRREFVRAPVWHDKPVAGGTPLTNGQSSFVFDRPFVLSARDSMRVKVQLDAAPGSSPPATRTFAVGFTGYGLDSRRPYFLADELDIADAAQHELNTSMFRNDGDEPIVVTEMGIYVSAESLNSNPTGDIRIGRLQINQLGNGTGAEWVQGPTVDATGLNAGPDLIPAFLLGTQSGRAVVHKWPPMNDDPAGGLYWEPGEGIQLEVQAPASLTGGDAAVLAIAMIGSIVVS